MRQLVEMLSYQRPADSEAEAEFCQRFIAPLGASQDVAGNWIAQVGKSPRVLWSSHTDTVHCKSGRQTVHVDADLGLVRLSRKASRKHGSNCLGADCTAGVWLMSEMIRARVPGLYVFHAGEECGGIGSGHIATQTPALLSGIDYAIAFDRRSHRSVITHQWYGRCCSERFASELAAWLGHPYAPDDGGSFTDTANYTHLVPECTNVSVGYYFEHSARETLNYQHLFMLRDAMLEIDPTEFGVYRLPGRSKWDWHDDDDRYEYGYLFEQRGGGELVNFEVLAPDRTATILKQCLSELDGMSHDDVAAWVERNPDLASSYLAGLGF